MELRDLDYIIQAHTVHARKISNATRKWDNKTPYFIHPIWCATMILHETTLPEEIRKDGSQALLYHDVLEDTNEPLPAWLSPRVISLIRNMTFGLSEDEWLNLWGKDKEIRLLKVYDKTSNILDGSWMAARRRQKHIAHLKKLVADVRRNYGDLNILKIAETQY